MTENLTAAPVLSTPDTHIFSEPAPTGLLRSSEPLSDSQLVIRYEISRTVREIKQHKWRQVALQFPDQMLRDSARVFHLLAREVNVGRLRSSQVDSPPAQTSDATETVATDALGLRGDKSSEPVKFTILADTSYGSCCVDEIAAEHVEADVVIHYGRSCLSPTARLPVVYIFTTRDLDHQGVIDAFQTAFPSRDAKVVLTADIPYADHVSTITSKLVENGYSNLFAASIVHNPAAPIPNRTSPDDVGHDESRLLDWHLFHISDPPTSLLLTMSSRMSSVHIHQTDNSETASLQANTSLMLRRRYALITSLATVSVWGILINTLSVKNYLHIVDHVKSQIAQARKKSYLFVVGKLNAAKVANFSEIGGWVVIGCWESSLVDSKDFYKPIITPFELDLALRGDQDRVWTGAWRGDFQNVLDTAAKHQLDEHEVHTTDGSFHQAHTGSDQDVEDDDSEEESAPPEFDLRTGRYVSHPRPMQPGRGKQQVGTLANGRAVSTALATRAKGDVFAVNGVVSPAAEFLAQKRTWRGLGSDFEIKYDEEETGSAIEEGRTGVARGYTTGESSRT